MIRKLLLPFSLAAFCFSVCTAVPSYGQIVRDSLGTGLSFDTGFESGSLDKVRILSDRYILRAPDDSIRQIVCDVYSRHDPDNPADPSLAPSARWYHFLIRGVREKEIVLNIRHSDARRPFYSYDGKEHIRFSPDEAPDGKTLRKIYENDSVYIAYFIPYSSSYLQQRISYWSSRPSVQITGLGKSEHGRNMPMLVITNGENKGKKKIYIHGRIHPSESPSSWHLDQMIEILSGNSDYANDLREGAVFYILPFTNPDGVQEGMSRSNGEGINLEVDWDKPESLTAKEVKNIRSFLQEVTSDGKPLDLVLNMHSQSDNFATYWVHKAESTSDIYYKDLMLFSCLTTDRNPYFHKEDLSFSNVAPRYVEGWLWNRFGENTLAICFETPYTFYNSNPEGEWVTLENLRAMAIHNVYAIGDYLGIPTRSRLTVSEPKRGKRVKKGSDLSYTFFGKGYLVAGKDGARVTYKLKNLPRGEYEVYKWDAGKNTGAEKNRKNEWVKAGDYTQTKDGKFKYTLSGIKNGGIIDSILLLKK